MQILTSPNTYMPPSRGPETAATSPEAKSAQQELLATLGKHLKAEQVDEIVNADQADFSAQSVSSRIADFVARGLAGAASRGASPERLESMYQSALAGVRKGFDEALGILQAMQQFTGSVKELYNETEALTFDKLAQINPAEATAKVTESVAAALEYRESFKLKLVTQDGDKVEIRFNNRESIAAQAETNSVALATQSQSSYELKVKGELDDAEYRAIENLLSQVSEVADSFYAGRLNEAFDLASELQLDPSELARLDLNLQQSRRIELQQYQQVEKQAHPEHPWAQRLQDWLGSVEVLRSSVEELFSQSDNALNEMLLAALDVSGHTKGVPPGLEKVLAERLS